MSKAVKETTTVKPSKSDDQQPGGLTTHKIDVVKNGRHTSEAPTRPEKPTKGNK